MSKSPDAFRTISEVAEWLAVQAHVLRFWESKFPQLKPVKRAGGRRYYRPADMLLLGGIRYLLHDQGMSIKDVQALLREKGAAHLSAMSHPLEDPFAPDAAGTYETTDAVAAQDAPPAASKNQSEDAPHVISKPVSDIAPAPAPSAAEPAPQPASPVAAPVSQDPVPSPAPESAVASPHPDAAPAAPQPEPTEPAPAEQSPSAPVSPASPVGQSAPAPQTSTTPIATSAPPPAPSGTLPAATAASQAVPDPVHSEAKPNASEQTSLDLGPASTPPLENATQKAERLQSALSHTPSPPQPVAEVTGDTGVQPGLWDGVTQVPEPPHAQPGQPSPSAHSNASPVEISPDPAIEASTETARIQPPVAHVQQQAPQTSAVSSPVAATVPPSGALTGRSTPPPQEAEAALLPSSPPRTHEAGNADTPTETAPPIAALPVTPEPVVETPDALQAVAAGAPQTVDPVANPDLIASETAVPVSPVATEAEQPSITTDEPEGPVHIAPAAPSATVETAAPSPVGSPVAPAPKLPTDGTTVAPEPQAETPVTDPSDPVTTPLPHTAQSGWMSEGEPEDQPAALQTAVETSFPASPTAIENVEAAAPLATDQDVNDGPADAAVAPIAPIHETAIAPATADPAPLSAHPLPDSTPAPQDVADDDSSLEKSTPALRQHAAIATEVAPPSPPTPDVMSPADEVVEDDITPEVPLTNATPHAHARAIEVEDFDLDTFQDAPPGLLLRAAKTVEIPVQNQSTILQCLADLRALTERA